MVFLLYYLWSTILLLLNLIDIIRIRRQKKHLDFLRMVSTIQVTYTKAKTASPTSRG